jgi:hypothetical protein
MADFSVVKKIEDLSVFLKDFASEIRQNPQKSFVEVQNAMRGKLFS